MNISNSAEDLKIYSDEVILMYINKIILSVSKLKKILEPSFLKKLLGQASSEKSRLIANTVFEEVRFARKKIYDLCSYNEVGKNYILSEIFERLFKHIDKWSEVVVSFRNIKIGSEDELITACDNLLKFLKEIKNINILN